MRCQKALYGCHKCLENSASESFRCQSSRSHPKSVDQTSSRISTAKARPRDQETKHATPQEQNLTSNNSTPPSNTAMPLLSNAGHWFTRLIYSIPWNPLAGLPALLFWLNIAFFTCVGIYGLDRLRWRRLQRLQARARAGLWV